MSTICLQCKDWHCPKIALRDKILHTAFVLSLIVMIACAIATVMCFITDKEQLAEYKVIIYIRPLCELYSRIQWNTPRCEITIRCLWK